MTQFALLLPLVPHRDRPVERPCQQRVPREMLRHAAHRKSMMLQRGFSFRLLFTRFFFAHCHQVIDHDLSVLAPSDHIRVRVVENALDFILLGSMRLVPTCQSAIMLTRSKAAQSFAPILQRCWMSCWQRSTARREKRRQN